MKSSLIFRITRKFFRETFNFWQMLGFHIIPIHFYSPIPDTRTLKKSIWEDTSELLGINMNAEKQKELLSRISDLYRKEYEALPENKIESNVHFYRNNSEFGPVDVELLYGIVRYFKPKRILEIGSGYSTALSAQAILKNKEEGRDCDLIAIDPYPKKLFEKGFPGLSKLDKREVQDVSLSEFENLKENDILFIDSSHVLKIGSDVQYEYLEILPRLHKGVIIHIHDIFLPAEYPKRWIMQEKTFFNEQYLLQAFLMFNSCFEVIFAGSFMHLYHPELLKKAFSFYIPEKTLPGSFWIRKC